MLSKEELTGRTKDLLTILRQLVEIESPSNEKAAVDRVRVRVSEELQRLGAAVTVDVQSTTGDHVIGRWVEGGGREGLLLLCHMDTVHPLGTLERFPCTERDGRLYGPGALDMKAGIALALVTLSALKEAGRWPDRPITALFTADEETGSHSSRQLIEHLARQSGLVLCLEPGLPDGSLKTWRKGVGGFEVTTHGRAAHAGGNYEQGRNAIEELAHQVIAIQRMTDYSKGTTLNVGVIQGGSFSNVVPDRARAVVDLRVMVPEEADRIMESMRSLSPVLEGTTLEVQGGMNRPPMPRDERMAVTFEKACSIAAGLGLRLTEGGTGGGSDANFVAPLGVPVLDGLGALGEGMHSESEYVSIASLPQRIALLAALLTEW